MEGKVFKVFEKYEVPRLAVCLRPGDKYNLPGGWQDTEKEMLVIGETYDTYVTHVVIHKLGYWDECGRYEAISTGFLGFHKSRFVRWVDTQLELFSRQHKPLPPVPQGIVNLGFETVTV